MMTELDKIKVKEARRREKEMAGLRVWKTESERLESRLVDVWNPTVRVWWVNSGPERGFWMRTESDVWDTFLGKDGNEADEAIDYLKRGGVPTLRR